MIDVKISELPSASGTNDKGIANDLIEISRSGQSYKLRIEKIQNSELLNNTHATLLSSINANSSVVSWYTLILRPYTQAEGTMIVRAVSTKAVSSEAILIRTIGGVQYAHFIVYDFRNDKIICEYDFAGNVVNGLSVGFKFDDAANFEKNNLQFSGACVFTGFNGVFKNNTITGNSILDISVLSNSEEVKGIFIDVNGGTVKFDEAQENLNITVLESNLQKGFDVDGSNTIDATVDDYHNWAGIINLETGGQLDLIVGLSLLPKKFRVQPSKCFMEISNESTAFVIGDEITGTGVPTGAVGIITARKENRIYFKVTSGDFLTETQITNQNLDTADIDLYNAPQTVILDPTAVTKNIILEGTIVAPITLDGNKGDFIELEQDGGDCYQLNLKQY